MSSGSYFPPPVRRVDIPKGNEGTAVSSFFLLKIFDLINNFVKFILLVYPDTDTFGEFAVVNCPNLTTFSNVTSFTLWSAEGP